MKISWGKMIVDLSEVADASASGFHHVQMPADGIMNLSADEFARQKESFLQYDIIPEVCSSPLPDNVQVTEMGFNIYVWTEYLKKAIKRLAGLGCKKLAWNSGRARVLPWEGDTVGAKEQVLQFLYLLCDVADEYGMTILVEPLGPLRTNFLNTLDEMEDFLNRVGKQNLFSMISFRELGEIGLRIEDLASFSGLIRHVQLENPSEQKGGRVSPTPQDGIDYHPFLNQLKQIEYNGMICLPQDADAAALEYCRKTWGEKR